MSATASPQRTPDISEIVASALAEQRYRPTEISKIPTKRLVSNAYLPTTLWRARRQICFGRL